jgi:hypothetical protein
MNFSACSSKFRGSAIDESAWPAMNTFASSGLSAVSKSWLMVRRFTGRR